MEICLYYSMANLFYYKYFRKLKLDNFVKVSMFIGINVIPIPYYTFKIFKSY